MLYTLVCSQCLPMLLTKLFISGSCQGQERALNECLLCAQLVRIRFLREVWVSNPLKIVMQIEDGIGSLRTCMMFYVFTTGDVSCSSSPVVIHVFFTYPSCKINNL